MSSHVPDDLAAIVPIPVVITDPANESALPPGWTRERLKRVDGGGKYSGTIPVSTGQRKSLLRAGVAGGEGMLGEATIHVSVDVMKIDRAFAGPDYLPANGRVKLWLTFGAGRGGEEQIAIDATNGAVVSVGGTESVEAEIEVIGDRAVSTITYAVTAVVNWGTSVSPKPVYNTDAAFILDAAGESPTVTDVIELPSRTQKMTLLCDAPDAVAGLEIAFYRDWGGSSAGPPPAPIYRYRAPDPTQLIACVSGARYYRISNSSSLPATVTPLYELSL